MNDNLKKLDKAIEVAICDYITNMKEEDSPVELIEILINTLSCTALTFAKKDKRENPIEMAKQVGMAVTLKLLSMAIGIKTDTKVQTVLASIKE